ncbi:ABC-type multidrug transport system, ATPase component [Chitinophaga costaii]|uniref:ABC-type multidrug transport system, ATPase component n=1 Tax=Chitinophaga costaii TaxID=1335309 RepID=A0A1C4EVM8_9BACT|nr:ATP-binding cassette domain-containing protein [Chitinophaga costaii]PUZ21616.1 hypothetical protein DCM91_16415 [Chitinophaga costaii]SCC47718.1 ABC-type multidrug transport system, ATPase component [Chitinophaga costaii]
MSITLKAVQVFEQQSPHGITLHIPDDGVVAVIGPLRSGVYTLVKMIATLTPLRGGSISINGWKVGEQDEDIRKNIGVVAPHIFLSKDRTIAENIDDYQVAQQITRLPDILDSPLFDQVRQKMEEKLQLSKGMGQLLRLYCALPHDPSTLVLLNPTRGVSTLNLSHFWQLIRTIKAKGKSILIISSKMQDATHCDQIALIKGGHIIAKDSPKTFIQQFIGQLYGVKVHHPLLLNAIRNFPNRADKKNLRLTLQGNQLDLASLKQHLLDNGFPNINIQPYIPTLEDGYIERYSYSKIRKPIYQR